MRRATWIGCVESVGGYCAAQLPDELRLLRIRVHGDDPVELVLLVEQVDHEVAGERGNGELRDRGERRLPVEARDEQLVRTGEEAEVLLGAAAARHVADDGDGGDDRALRRRAPAPR